MKRDNNKLGIPRGLEAIEMIDLQSFHHDSGDLKVVESQIDLPFSIQRIYFLHALGPKTVRGGHAHLNLWQFMIAIAGSFTLDLERGGGKTQFHLESPSAGILIPPLTWRELRNFTTDAVCLVLASELYKEDDYIRDYEEFSKIAVSER